MGGFDIGIFGAECRIGGENSEKVSGIESELNSIFDEQDAAKTEMDSKKTEQQEKDGSTESDIQTIENEMQSTQAQYETAVSQVSAATSAASAAASAASAAASAASAAAASAAATPATIQQQTGVDKDGKPIIQEVPNPAKAAADAAAAAASQQAQQAQAQATQAQQQVQEAQAQAQEAQQAVTDLQQALEELKGEEEQQEEEQEGEIEELEQKIEEYEEKINNLKTELEAAEQEAKEAEEEQKENEDNKNSFSGFEIDDSKEKNSTFEEDGTSTTEQTLQNGGKSVVVLKPDGTIEQTIVDKFGNPVTTMNYTNANNEQLLEINSSNYSNQIALNENNDIKSTSIYNHSTGITVGLQNNSNNTFDTTMTNSEGKLLNQFNSEYSIFNKDLSNIKVTINDTCIIDPASGIKTKINSNGTITYEDKNGKPIGEIAARKEKEAAKSNEAQVPTVQTSGANKNESQNNNEFENSIKNIEANIDKAQNEYKSATNNFVAAAQIAQNAQTAANDANATAVALRNAANNINPYDRVYDALTGKEITQRNPMFDKLQEAAKEAERIANEAIIEAKETKAQAQEAMKIAENIKTTYEIMENTIEENKDSDVIPDSLKEKVVDFKTSNCNSLNQQLTSANNIMHEIDTTQQKIENEGAKNQNAYFWGIDPSYKDAKTPKVASENTNNYKQKFANGNIVDITLNQDGSISTSVSRPGELVVSSTFSNDKNGSVLLLDNGMFKTEIDNNSTTVKSKNEVDNSTTIIGRKNDKNERTTSISTDYGNNALTSNFKYDKNDNNQIKANIIEYSKTDNDSKVTVETDSNGDVQYKNEKGTEINDQKAQELLTNSDSEHNQVAKLQTAGSNNVKTKSVDEKMSSEEIAKNYLGKELKECSEKEISYLNTLSVLFSEEESYKNIYNELINDSGAVKELSNNAKEFSGLETSQKDVENAIKLQEEINTTLLQSLKNGNFEEAWENISGNKFSPENVKEYKDAAQMFNFAQKGINEAQELAKNVENAQSTQEMFNLYKDYYTTDPNNQDDVKKAEEKAREEIAKQIEVCVKSTSSPYNHETKEAIEVTIDSNNNVHIKSGQTTMSKTNLFDMDIKTDQKLSFTRNGKLSEACVNSYKENFKKIVGTSYDDVVKNLYEKKDNLLGKSNRYQDNVEGYINSSDMLKNAIAGKAKEFSTYATTIGDLLILTGVGSEAGAGFKTAGKILGIVGTYVDQTLDFIDTTTSKKEKSEKIEDYKKIASETANEVTTRKIINPAITNASGSITDGAKSVITNSGITTERGTEMLGVAIYGVTNESVDTAVDYIKNGNLNDFSALKDADIQLRTAIGKFASLRNR